MALNHALTLEFARDNLYPAPKARLSAHPLSPYLDFSQIMFPQSGLETELT